MRAAFIESLGRAETPIELCIVEDWVHMSADPVIGPVDFDEFRAGYAAFECWNREKEGFAARLALAQAS
ncbi:MAG TPA: hypothetical protein VGJ81_05310 [Thermoanaerobaculia bacterium]|jgi:hypothetical protein